MPITIDSRGVSVYITDDEARAQAAELAARAEQALDIADARGWSLNASDAQRVQHDLDEAARLLTDVGDIKVGSPHAENLKRFVQPGWAEEELAARAAAEARRREQNKRMAAAVRLIDELGESDDDASNDASHVDTVERSDERPPREPVNMKRSFDSHGLEWWTVSGRGDTKRFADYATAEREARRRAMALEYKHAQPRCTALRGDGQPCRAAALVYGDFCARHDPDRHPLEATSPA